MNNRNRRLDIVLALGAARCCSFPGIESNRGFMRLPGLPISPESLRQHPVSCRFFCMACLVDRGPSSLRIGACSAVHCRSNAAWQNACPCRWFRRRLACPAGSGDRGHRFHLTISETVFGPLADGQPSMGAGAVLSAICFVLMFAFGLAERGVMRGDAFVVATISMLVFLVAVFVFYPIGSMFIGAFQDFDGSVSFDVFPATLSIHRSGASIASLAARVAAWHGARCFWPS